MLRERPKQINVKLLQRYPEFDEFRQRTKQEPSTDSVAERHEAISEMKLATPDELLRSTIADLEAALASELLYRILASPPSFFENLIVTLLMRMGYGGAREDAGRAIGKSGDGGIEGVIDQDPLGLDRIYLQVKRYKPDLGVSEPEIRAFSGSLGAAKASKGVFVTTSYFTRPAIEFAERHPLKIVLIDGAHLSTLMIRHGVGMRIVETLHLKKVDEDLFLED